MRENNNSIFTGVEPTTASKQAIVFACDDAYAPLVAVALISLIRCYIGNERLQVVVLSNNVSEFNKIKLLKLACNICSVEFVECSGLVRNFKKMVHNHRLSETIFTRIFVIDLFKKFQKILYLDADIVFNASVDELLKVKLSHPIMAVPDVFIETFRHIASDMGDYLKTELHLSPEDRYFNSGVILFDIELCRNSKNFSELLSIMKTKRYKWEDQDVLNIFFHNDFDLIDYRWNTIWLQNSKMQSVLEQNYEYKKALKNPAIIHFAGGVLPIRCIRSRFASYWWRYARQTEYFHYFLKVFVKLLCTKPARMVLTYIKSKTIF